MQQLYHALAVFQGSIVVFVFVFVVVFVFVSATVFEASVAVADIPRGSRVVTGH